jgi:hypothetical protein
VQHDAAHTGRERTVKRRKPLEVAVARPPGRAHSAGAVEWLRDNWLLVVLPIALVVFFWDVIVGRRFFWEDAVQLTYPSLSFLVTSLRSLHLPYWSPFVFGGMPFLPDLNNQTFYPGSWILALFAGSAARPGFLLVEMAAIGHLLVAGLGMNGLLRAWKLSKPAALFGGTVFMLSGFMTVRTIHLPVVATFAWMPLILLCLHRSLYDRKLGYAFAGAVVYGIAMLAGFVQIVVYMTYALGLYCLFSIFRNWSSQGPEALGRAIASILVVVLVGAGIAAIQYLPALKYVPYTVRSTLSYADQVEASLRPAQLLTLLVPKFFGSVSGSGPGMTDAVPFWAGGMNYGYWETVVYVGIMPLLLGIFALADRKQPQRWFLVSLASIALLLALGRYTPLYKLALAILPGFKQFRIPGRIGCLSAFGFAALAGCGMDFLFRPDAAGPARRLLKWTGVAVVAAGVLWLLFATGALRSAARQFSDPTVYASSSRQYGLFAVLLLLSLGAVFLHALRPGARALVTTLSLLLVFADLYAFGHRFNESPTRPDEYPYTTRAAVEPLLREAAVEPFRINVRRDNAILIGRNQGNLDRIELLEGYTPLKLSRFISFAIPEARLHDLMNVKYRLNAAGRGLEPNPTMLPRARMVYRYQAASSDSAALRLLRDDSFDHRSIAVVETAPGFASHVSDSISSVVHITSRAPDRMAFDVTTDSTGILVLSEVYFPEWRATLDGRPVLIYPVDCALRGITIPAGTHRVEMFYGRRWVTAGAGISFAALLFAVAGILLPRRRGPRRTPA